ncbi:MAG TPA: hypothetical protein VJ916_03045 [Anaerovoracaceae bacterium]|nr:hypothetical protein [Anaerovoracaceae bacterium]
MNVLDRLLKYIPYDTQSKEGLDYTLSTEKEFQFAKELELEMKGIVINGTAEISKVGIAEILIAAEE